MKQRPLRRACLASASVVPGASGSKSPRAPKKSRSALETFPAAIISSKTGAAPMPTPSADTAGSCRIARATRWGSVRRKLQRHQRTGAMRKHICRSANVFDHGLQVGGLSGKIIAAVCRFAAATATTAVIGNDAIATGELAGDAVKKCAVDARTVHAHQGGRIGRYIRAGILAAGNRGARIFDRKIHVVILSSTPSGRTEVRLGQSGAMLRILKCVYCTRLAPFHDRVPKTHQAAQFRLRQQYPDPRLARGPMLCLSATVPRSICLCLRF